MGGKIGVSELVFGDLFFFLIKIRIFILHLNTEMFKKINHFVYRLYKILVMLFLNLSRQFILSFSQQKILNM